MYRSAPTHRLALVVTGWLLALSVVGPTTILCVGSGGHLAIEGALAQCCDPEPDHGHGGVELTKGDRCADHCTDTPVGIYATRPNPDPTSPARHVLVSAPFRSGGNRAAAFLSGRPLAPPPPLPPPRALRITVNLC